MAKDKLVHKNINSYLTAANNSNKLIMNFFLTILIKLLYKNDWRFLDIKKYRLKLKAKHIK